MAVSGGLIIPTSNDHIAIAFFVVLGGFIAYAILKTLSDKATSITDKVISGASKDYDHNDLSKLSFSEKDATTNLFSIFRYRNVDRNNNKIVLRTKGAAFISVCGNIASGNYVLFLGVEEKTPVADPLLVFNDGYSMALRKTTAGLMYSGGGDQFFSPQIGFLNKEVNLEGAKIISSDKEYEFAEFEAQAVLSCLRKLTKENSLSLD